MAEVLHRWIAGKLSEILGSEDDVVTELCFNLIEGTRFVGSATTVLLATGADYYIYSPISSQCRFN